MSTALHAARWLTLAAILLVLGGAAAMAADEELRLYVSPKGSDTAAGTREAPFASLERARDEIRKLKAAGQLPSRGAEVEVAAGVYELSRAFALGKEDSGTAGAPITYRAARGAEVRLVGGKQVTNFRRVTDPAILKRLDAGARDKIMQADLKALGLTDYGNVVSAGQRLEVFFQDQPMLVSRWPNEGFAKIVDVTGGSPHKIHGIPGDKIGKFIYDGDRPSRWLEEKNLFLHGYWFWDWSDERQSVESIDPATKTITLKPPYHTYGYRKGAWWAAFNCLAELDAPGEWYLDKDSGILYFHPPAPLTKGKVLISVIPTLISLDGASQVTLRGFTLEATRGTAVTLSNCERSRVVGCVIRNNGGSAVSVSGGKNNGVIGCDVYNQAAGGIHLSGGDRPSLTPCGNYADNNHVHHYARWNRVYNPGITLQGVGCRATHNLIDNAPHMAMGFGGNDHVIEYNEIHSVCYESNDAGAIYTGRNWSMWGTVLQYNYLHHINGREGKGCVGMYLDDQFSGTRMDNNLFYKVTRAAMIGGGRYCTIENNIFVDCVPATHVDDRGLGWAAGGFEGMKAGLEAMPYKSDLWRARFPNMTNTLEDNPMAPVGNVIARNICVGGRWGDFGTKGKQLTTFTDNLIDQDPLFVDAANLNFNLKPESPALKLGFKPLPIAEMGLYESRDRASWPVKSDVRPLEAPPAAVAAAKAPRGPAPTVKVERLKSPITVDGVFAAGEWGGADPLKALLIEQEVDGTKVTPRSLAWLAWDDQALYVAMDNPCNPKFPIRMGNAWGQDDAVEIAVRNPADNKNPILVLRGFPSGHFQSTDEAGASEAAAKQAAQGVQYKAKLADSKRWLAEWRIPWTALGMDPAKVTKLQFNLSVRKSADEQWLLWVGTNACTWEVTQAGAIELAK